MHASTSPEQEYPSLLPVSASVDFSEGLISFCLIIKPIAPPISSECIYCSIFAPDHRNLPKHLELQITFGDPEKIENRIDK